MCMNVKNDKKEEGSRAVITITGDNICQKKKSVYYFVKKIPPG